MGPSLMVSGLIFLAVSGLVLLVFWVVERGDRLDSRLEELSTDNEKPPTKPSSSPTLTRPPLPKLSASLLPKTEAQRTRLQNRLYHAGYYDQGALGLFLGVKIFLMLLPWGLGLLIGLLGFLSFRYSMPLGGLLSVLGMVVPEFWLRRKKQVRQAGLREALPDVLDVLVICLEGGLSLPAAFGKVTAELSSAHPRLAVELGIVQWEMQLGKSLGDAIRHFGVRSDLDEVRSLAGVIDQNERLGTGLVKALRVHAEGMRFKQVQLSEEMAHRAAAKILFPTLLLIFPAIFVIILGPAAIQLQGLYHTMTIGKQNPSQASKGLRP